MEESLYQKVYRLPLVKESFSLITEMVVRSTMMVMTMSEWFLGFDEKGKDVYMKHCTDLIQPIAESNHKKKCTKTDNRVVHVEREEERDPEVEMMVRRRRTMEENKLVMRCFYQGDPTRRGYRKRMIAI